MATTSRLKLFLADYGTILAVALVVLGLLALANAGWIATHPPTETVSEETDVQTVGSALESSSVVTGPSLLYDQGETLSDMPVYFLSSNPDLTLTVASSTPDGVETTITTRVIIEQTATRQGEVFFQTNRTIIDRTDRTASGQVLATTDVNMTALRAEIERNRGETDGIGSYTTRLSVTVQYQTDTYEGRFASSVPIVFTRGAYWLDGDIAEQRRHARTTTRAVTRPFDRSSAIGYGLLGLLLIGAGVLLRDRARDIDVESLSMAADHDQFDEWISSGEFPTGTEKRYVAITSLPDLVDVAIDSNKRVIYDDALEVYCVIDGDLVYYFSREPFNIDVWLDT